MYIQTLSNEFNANCAFSAELSTSDDNCAEKHTNCLQMSNRIAKHIFKMEYPQIAQYISHGNSLADTSGSLEQPSYGHVWEKYLLRYETITRKKKWEREKPTSAKKKISQRLGKQTCMSIQ